MEQFTTIIIKDVHDITTIVRSSNAAAIISVGRSQRNNWTSHSCESVCRIDESIDSISHWAFSPEYLLKSMYPFAVIVCRPTMQADMDLVESTMLKR